MPPTFGRCRVIEELGAGSLSVVYLAVQEPLGREVAIKALSGSISVGSSFAAQLEREAKLLSELSHPNVVSLYELVKTESQLFLVLEHVPGPDLAAVLARKPKTSPEATAIVGAAVARALDHAHERGIVHRDVKPGNIILSLRGDVKLIDFGIAHRTRRPGAGEPVEVEGQAFGTPAYMSPEQILGDTPDPRSDLFSLGVVLYQMLSGSRPFDSAEPSDQRASTQRIRRSPAAPLRVKAPEVPRSLERIVMRLLEKLPSDRYATAGALADELEEFASLHVRGSPRGVLARALRDAGFSKTIAPSGESTEEVDPALRPTYAGFAALFGLAVCLATWIQLSDSGFRAASHAGEAPLPLVPPAAASLNILARPWAEVYVDGEHVETTPFARPIPLAPGEHFVTLKHPDAPDEQRTVQLGPGEVSLIEVAMRIRDAAPQDAAFGHGDAGLGGGS